MAQDTNTRPVLVDLLEQEIEKENEALRSDLLKLWGFARQHTGKTDAEIQLATGVRLPQVWEVL